MIKRYIWTKMIRHARQSDGGSAYMSAIMLTPTMANHNHVDTGIVEHCVYHYRNGEFWKREKEVEFESCADYRGRTYATLTDALAAWDRDHLPVPT